MDVTKAEAYNTLRGYTDWTGNTDTAAKAAALVRAQDHIDAYYTLRLNLTPDELARVDSAICLLARDMLTDKTPSIRAKAAVAKESKELAGMKKSVEYADTPADPYPYITALLSSLVVSATSSFSIGKLVR